MSRRRLTLPDSTVTKMLWKSMKYKLMEREECPEEKQSMSENLSYVKSRLTDSHGKDGLFINGAETGGRYGGLTIKMAPTLHPSLHILLAKSGFSSFHKEGVSFPTP